MEQAIIDFQQLWEQLIQPERLQALLSVIVTIIFVWIITRIILNVGKM